MKDNKDIFSWKKIVLELLAAAVAVTGVILYTDSREYFEGDQTNNHAERKWRSFYRFSQKEHRNADIVILGNSHASAGFDPYTISAATGCYCFILNSPGTTVAIARNDLREILKYSKPGIVLIETMSLYDDGGGADWGIIQSINAKQGFFNRVSMLPGILPFDRWPKALSSTIRNHDFLFTNPEQIRRNISLMGKEKNPDRRRYDFGRFSHGQGNISQKTLEKYAQKPSVGAEGKIVPEKNIRQLDKVYALCKRKGIQLGFITAPIYDGNYADYSVVRSQFEEVVSRYPGAFWFDLQSSYDRNLYGTDAFMDEYGICQHNSSKGMILNTNSLVEYLMQNYPALLPDRRSERVWQNALRDFSYKFAYMRWPQTGWKECRLIVKDKEISSIPVNEFFVCENQSQTLLFLRIARNANDTGIPNALLVDASPDGNTHGNLYLMSRELCSSPEWYLFSASIQKGTQIGNLKGIYPYD